MTPDLLGGDITNPQSLNRYAYALNNPTTLTDPSGLCPPCRFKLYKPVLNDFGDEFDYAFPSWSDNEGDFGLSIDPLGLAFVMADFGAFHGSGGGFIGGIFDTPLNLVPPGGQPKACSALKYAQARSFISANLDYAQQIASQLNTAAGNILGLSGNESGWGTGFLITAGTNNYFSLTTGPAFGGTIGTYRRGSYSYGRYPSPGFLTSGLSFANSYFGARVNGITVPLSFAQALNANNSFNSEKLATPYDQAIANTINLANTLLACP